MTTTVADIKSLLDRKMRVQAGQYSYLGYCGYVIKQLLAYIELLEERLAQIEAAENRGA